MKLLFIHFFILSFSFCSAQNNSKDNWQWFNTNDFKVSYPVSWTFDSSKKMGAAFVIFSQIENKDDRFRENVNCIIQNLEGQQIDLDKYVEITEGQIKTLATESKIYSSQRIITGKAPYHKLIYSATQGIYKLKFEQFYFIKNSKAFVITFTAELDKFDSFNITGS